MDGMGPGDQGEFGYVLPYEYDTYIQRRKAADAISLMTMG